MPAAELERAEKRLSTLAAVRPPYMDEYETLTGKLQVNGSTANLADVLLGILDLCCCDTLGQQWHTCSSPYKDNVITLSKKLQYVGDSCLPSTI